MEEPPISNSKMERGGFWLGATFPHVLLVPMCVPLNIPVESPVHVSPFTGFFYSYHISRIVARFAQKERKRKQWPVFNKCPEAQENRKDDITLYSLPL